MMKSLALLLLLLVVLSVGAFLVARVLRGRPSLPAKPRPAPRRATAAAAAAEDDVSPAPAKLNRIEGKVRASSMKTVGEIVDGHPDEAVSVLRRWIRSDDPPG